LPRCSVYPRGLRGPRAWLPRRTSLARRRAEALAHLVNTNSQYNLPPLGKKLCYAANRAELDLPSRFDDPSVRANVEVDLALIDGYDEQIHRLESLLVKKDRVDDAQGFARLQSITEVD